MALRGRKARKINIDVPVDSDLPIRLKSVSEQTKLSYCELLEKWLFTEERENQANEKHREEEFLKWTQQFEARLADIQSQLFALWKKPEEEGGPSEQDYRRVLLQRIRNLRNEGMSFVKISEMFNKEGVPTVSGTGKWYPSSISQFLTTNGTF
ncbi:MAG: hypothetical protein LBJ36_07800 [Synergistaceae bacterium]|jgi:hypothetical protein|nr:hypothetical protein [Synergistaceae bacterium]